MSLNGATSTGAGVVRDLETVLVNHIARVAVTGSPASLTIELEGSLDGTDWYRLAQSTQTSAAFSIAAYGSFPVPARYIRANVTVLTGGSSPTVTVTVGSA